MVFMRIALINATKPEPGTGDKITEYTYQLYKHLSKNNKDKIDVLYAIGETKPSNTIGLIYTNTIFRSMIPGLAKKNYDIIHITNQEIGFAAKILRENGEKGVIITTLHDTLRMRNDLHRGIRQKMYSNLTTLNIRNALETSSMIIFDDEKTKDEVKELHKIKDDVVIPLGINESIIKTPLKKRITKKNTVIGYIGDSLSSNKNLMMLLEAANLLKSDKSYSFEIYGSGVEQESLNMYKIANDLDNVEFKSRGHASKLVDVYDSFDIFVYPALGETYAIPILEAFGRGLPVIVDSKSRYINDIKRYCIGVKDAHQLVKAIKETRQNVQNQKRMENALKYARSLTWDRTAKETYGIYTKLVNKSKQNNM